MLEKLKTSKYPDTKIQKYLLKRKSARQVFRLVPKYTSPYAVGQEIDYLKRLLNHQMLKNRLFSLLKLALAELSLKKLLSRSKIRILKIWGNP